MALTLYFVRHGRTEWNAEGLLQGSGDSPLLPEGILGAQRTGQALADVPLLACYSSLQKRAIDTANHILGNRDVPHFHHRGLNELNFGLWEGKPSLALREHPEYILLKTDPKSYQALENQGETIDQLQQRARKALSDILRAHQNQSGNILIVSHGMTLTVLTAMLKGIHWHDFRDEKRHAFVVNTAISIAEVVDGQARLTHFNLQDHL